MSFRVAVIGGGAAGFFSAISVKTHQPDAEVIIFEKSLRLLSKVRISGGGRCNVTNGCDSISELSKAYPRGGKSLKKLFHQFSTQDTIKWFEDRGVALKTEPDGRVFPVTDRSETIIDCLVNEAKRLEIQIRQGTMVQAISREDSGLRLTIKDQVLPPFDKVIVATGGSPKESGLNWLTEMGHEIEKPVPSLFTFNMPAEPITTLMGVSVANAAVSIQGTKLKSNGPLLITHWGMSGPAILRLSAFGARILHRLNYECILQVNWINEHDHNVVLAKLQATVYSRNADKQLTNHCPFPIPQKLWHYLISRAGIASTRRWKELGKKQLNKLTSNLSNDPYTVRGKTTFKEEFVTCGGVSLECVNMATMESKIWPNLYFAGEVLDIDAITGGYNFQAAWTTGYISGQLQ